MSTISQANVLPTSLSTAAAAVIVNAAAATKAPPAKDVGLDPAVQANFEAFLAEQGFGQAAPEATPQQAAPALSASLTELSTDQLTAMQSAPAAVGTSPVHLSEADAITQGFLSSETGTLSAGDAAITFDGANTQISSTQDMSAIAEQAQALMNQITAQLQATPYDQPDARDALVGAMNNALAASAAAGAGDRAGASQLLVQVSNIVGVGTLPSAQGDAKATGRALALVDQQQDMAQALSESLQKLNEAWEGLDSKMREAGLEESADRVKDAFETHKEERTEASKENLETVIKTEEQKVREAGHDDLADQIVDFGVTFNQHDIVVSSDKRERNENAVTESLGSLSIPAGIKHDGMSEMPSMGAAPSSLAGDIESALAGLTSTPTYTEPSADDRDASLADVTLVASMPQVKTGFGIG